LGIAGVAVRMAVMVATVRFPFRMREENRTTPFKLARLIFRSRSGLVIFDHLPFRYQ
jgi:hypothetical protein